MIDIVKKGEIPTWHYRYRWNCRRCGCEFTCDKGDMKSEDLGTSRYDLITYTTVFDKLFMIDCPTCGQLLTKKDEELEECKYKVPNS